jgi:hypothetical protein
LADEVLHGRHELREQRSANFVLARKRCELFFDPLCVQNLALENAALDEELLVSVLWPKHVGELLTEVLNDLGRCRRIFEAPSDRSRADEVGRELFVVGQLRALERLSDDVVLDDLVLDSRIAETRAEV